MIATMLLVQATDLVPFDRNKPRREGLVSCIKDLDNFSLILSLYFPEKKQCLLWQLAVAIRPAQIDDKEIPPHNSSFSL
jgi:hypothetical protein